MRRPLAGGTTRTTVLALHTLWRVVGYGSFLGTAAAVLLAVLVLGEWRTPAAEIKPAQDAPQPMFPEDSAKTIQLPADLRIELVASEPLIQDPTCIAFDPRGRIFVCELHGYNLEGHLDVTELNRTDVLDKTVRRIRWEHQGGKIAEQARLNQYGTVKRLTDRDGDGRMDQVDVWADHLPPCYGIVPARDGLIVVCAPDIVYLADRDGDGKAEIREILYTGFHFELLERGINNPRWGLDNWIYVGAGGGGGTIRGPGLSEPVQIGHSDFRIKADGTAIEPVNGTVGTFGLALSDLGDRFPCSGGQPAVYALPLPYRYLKRNQYVSSPEGNHSAADYSRGYRISQPHPWRTKRAQDPAWVKFYGQRETDNSYFTGGCGGEIYRAELFPEPYRSNFFYCEPSLNMVHRCILTREGAGYRARRAPGEEQSEFLAATDGWFRPINLRVGPDGALYIVDMYREIIEDYSAIPRFLQQQYGVIQGDDRGRIWRVLPVSTKGREWADLSNWSTDDLVRATGDPNAWWRQTAQRLLIQRGEHAAAPALAEQVRGGASPQARVHALYTLDGLGDLQPQDVLGALGDPSYGVRLHALQLADDLLDADHQLLTKVASMTDDPDPRVRLQLAMTLGQSSDPRAMTALVQVAERYGHQRWMAAAILSSAGDTARPLSMALLGAGTPGKGARALLAPLAATIGGRRDSAELARVLNRIVKQDEAVQLACLQGLVDGLSHGQEPIPVSSQGLASVKELLGSRSTRVQTLATQLGARLHLANSPQMRAAFARAAEQALDVDRPIDERRSAVLLLANATYETLAPTATRLLGPRQPPGLQLSAIRALAAADDQRVGATLFAAWRELTPGLREEVLKAAFDRENRIPALLDAIERKLVRPGEIHALRREQLAQSQNRQLAARAKALLENPAADRELQQRLVQYETALAGRRDPQRGRDVFAQHCLVCHQVKNEGFEVGPKLGSVINKPDEAILFDILNPSRHIESEYTTYTVLTNRGLTLTGILVSDSATSVTLREERGANRSILRKDIDVMRESELSLMPSNLHQLITPQDAADLIAYLRKTLGTP